MLSAKEQKLLEALEPRAAQEGVEIVTLEIAGGKKSPTIRVYIDEPGGVSFDELASAQAWIGALMDEIDPFPGAYMLEVSSPGIDRPLRTPAHFARAVGQTVVVKTTAPLEGRSSFTAQLAQANEDCITLQLDDKHTSIAFDNIKRAHVKGNIDFSL